MGADYAFTTMACVLMENLYNSLKNSKLRHLHNAEKQLLASKIKDIKDVDIYKTLCKIYVDEVSKKNDDLA